MVAVCATNTCQRKAPGLGTIHTGSDVTRDRYWPGATEGNVSGGISDCRSLVSIRTLVGRHCHVQMEGVPLHGPVKCFTVISENSW